MLLCPEATAEQRLNVREAERLGIARAVRHAELGGPGLRRMVDELDARRAALPAAAPAGNDDAVAALERAAAELGGRARYLLPRLAGRIG
jgi:hypothetical protein